MLITLSCQWIQFIPLFSSLVTINGLKTLTIQGSDRLEALPDRCVRKWYQLTILVELLTAPRKLFHFFTQLTLTYVGNSENVLWMYLAEGWYSTMLTFDMFTNIRGFSITRDLNNSKHFLRIQFIFLSYSLGNINGLQTLTIWSCGRLLALPDRLVWNFWCNFVGILCWFFEEIVSLGNIVWKSFLWIQILPIVLISAWAILLDFRHWRSAVVAAWKLYLIGRWSNSDALEQRRPTTMGT